MQIEGLKIVCFEQIKWAWWFSPDLVKTDQGLGAQKLYRVLGGMKLPTLGPHLDDDQHLLSLKLYTVPMV